MSTTVKDEPPVFWTRCYKCGQVVKTTDTVRMEIRKEVFNGPAFPLLRVNQSGYADICLKCSQEKMETGEITKEEIGAIQEVFSYVPLIVGVVLLLLFSIPFVSLVFIR